MIVEKDIQTFITLTDTIHDYGKTANIGKSLIDKQKENVDDLNGDDDPENKKEFNGALLLDFLMLSILRDEFMRLIGLNDGQHYIKDKDDCTDKPYIHQSDLYKNICARFYWPTYVKNQLFRTTKPEERQREVLYKYLSENCGTDFDKTKEFYYNQKNTLRPESDLYVYDLRLGINKKNKTQFFSEDLDRQAEYLNDTIKSFYGYKKKDIIIFITDANQLNNDLFVTQPNYHYRGVFTRYDTFLTKKDEQDRVIKEHLTYELMKDKNELLFFDRMSVESEDVKYVLKYTVNNITQDIDLSDHELGKPRGLRLFFLSINEINKKTLGVLKFTDNLKRDLIRRLEKVSFEAIEKRYKITLDIFKDDLQKRIYTILNKYDFIRALFDLKRSMDYLYIKACEIGNSQSKSLTGSNRKYIFVTNDTAAISYANLLNLPCILTPPARGVQRIKLYRIRDGKKEKIEFVKTKEELEKIQLLDDVYEQEAKFDDLSSNISHKYIKNEKSIVRRDREIESLRKNVREEKKLDGFSIIRNNLLEKREEYEKCKDAIDEVYEIVEEKKKSIKKEKLPLSNADIENRKIIFRNDLERTFLSKIKDTSILNDNNSKVRKTIKPRTDNVFDRERWNKHTLTYDICEDVLNQELTGFKQYKNNFKEIKKGDNYLEIKNKRIHEADPSFNDIRKFCKNSHDDFKNEFGEFVKKGGGRKNNYRFNNNNNNKNTIPAYKTESKINYDKILDQKISLKNNSFVGNSEFDKFLTMYSELNDEITFFWFLTYKSLFFFMDKTGKEKIFRDDYLNVFDDNVQEAQNLNVRRKNLNNRIKIR